MNKVSQKLVLYFKPDSQFSPEKILNQWEPNRSVLNVTKIYSLGFYLNLKVAQNNFSKIKTFSEVDLLTTDTDDAKPNG